MGFIWVGCSHPFGTLRSTLERARKDRRVLCLRALWFHHLQPTDGMVQESAGKEIASRAGWIGWREARTGHKGLRSNWRRRDWRWGKGYPGRRGNGGIVSGLAEVETSEFLMNEQLQPSPLLPARATPALLRRYSRRDQQVVQLLRETRFRSVGRFLGVGSSRLLKLSPLNCWFDGRTDNRAALLFISL